MSLKLLPGRIVDNLEYSLFCHIRSGVVLDCIAPDLCLLPYLDCFSKLSCSCHFARQGNIACAILTEGTMGSNNVKLSLILNKWVKRCRLKILFSSGCHFVQGNGTFVQFN